jgi:PhnB protein
MNVQAYLFFNGRCEEAIEFYQRAVGAKVEMLMRHKDMPEPDAKPAPGMANKVLHAAFRIGDTQVLASDGHAEGPPAKFEGFALAISAQTDVETQRLFTALSEGGTVNQPLIKTFFSSQFGMVADRFGVLWMVLTEGEAS